MLPYLLRRVLAAIPTLIGVSVVVFLMVRLLPGDPARVVAGTQATESDVASIRQQLGLDEPAPVQYTVFLSHLVRLDLGTSIRTSQPVASEVFERLPRTVELATSSIGLATLMGVAAGVVAALNRGRRLDGVISALVLIGVSLPVYWLGLLLIVLFAIDLRWLPAAGSEDPGAWVMPTLALSALPFALIARTARMAMLETLGATYVMTAYAKGLSTKLVVYRHALRNALPAIGTVVGLQFGTLLGGAVLTEWVFGWPGLGQLLVQALLARDYPLVQGIVLTFSVLYIAIGLAIDLGYAALDPRVR